MTPKEKEFNLSNKIIEADNKKKDNGFYWEKDVKEFIRLLKEAGSENDWDIMLIDGEDGDITISFNDWIDKLTGDKFI